MQNNPQRGPHRTRLTRAGKRLATMLEEGGRPVILRRDFFHLIQRMYREERKELRLRREKPETSDYHRFCRQLKSAHIFGKDDDYGDRVWRVLQAHDLPADEIICIVDPFCHVSHLSAMQRWGLTDRIPRELMITRPDRGTTQSMLKVLTENEEPGPFPATNIHHPEHVRKRPVRLRETRYPGTSVQNPTGFVRVATIGQTFLDMLRNPKLCGGMAHVLDVWQEHADNWLGEIIEAVDESPGGIAKCRAGYILEERLGIHNNRIDSWKTAAQRGGSRKLDPLRPFSPEYSETWMISLNA